MTPRVVVVDDEAASASVLARLLTRLGCDVRPCTDPWTALPLVLSTDVDLVCLDLTMPALDGYQLLALIRSHEHSRRSPSVPVIAVTGRVSPEDRADALADGFAAHLAKPVLVESLRRAMSRALTLRTDLLRTRYTHDRASIQARMERLRDCGDAQADSLQVAAGMALAVERQGSAVLRRSLRLAFADDPDAARAVVSDFARLACTLGAERLCQALLQLAGQFGQGDVDVCETAAVLARAELDRVVFTLREQIRS